MLSYIELVNRFWQLDEQQRFSGDETRLYFYLLKVANKWTPAWPKSFDRADPLVAAENGLSINTMKKYRDRLVLVGLIDFEPGGKGQASRTIYQVRYQNLTPKPIESEEEVVAQEVVIEQEKIALRCQIRYQKLTPNKSALVSKTDSYFDTYSIYKRLKTLSLSKASVSWQIIEAPKSANQVPPPKPSDPPQPKPEDPFLRKSAAEKCNVPFSTWFAAYNYRKFEEGCRDIWPMLSDAERQQAMTHTPEYVKSTPNKQFRKSPLAYLQDKGFNDEIINRTVGDAPKPPPPVSEPVTHLKSVKPD